MMLEAELVALWKGAVGGRIYPDTTPDVPQFPLATFQQVGGQARWYLEKKVPDHRHARIQVNVWAKSRMEANQIALTLARLLAESALVAEPYGEFEALYDEHLKLYGTRQDFGIWHRDTE